MIARGTMANFQQHCVQILFSLNVYVGFMLMCVFLDTAAPLKCTFMNLSKNNCTFIQHQSLYYDADKHP